MPVRAIRAPLLYAAAAIGFEFAPMPYDTRATLVATTTDAAFDEMPIDIDAESHGVTLIEMKRLIDATPTRRFTSDCCVAAR